MMMGADGALQLLFLSPGLQSFLKHLDMRKKIRDKKIKKWLYIYQMDTVAP